MSDIYDKNAPGEKIWLTLTDFLIRREHSLNQGAIAAGSIDMGAASSLRKAAAITGHMADELQRAVYYGRGTPDLPALLFYQKNIRIFTSEDTAEKHKGTGEICGALMDRLTEFIEKKVEFRKLFGPGSMEEEAYDNLFDHLDETKTWTIRDLAIQAYNAIAVKLEGRQTGLCRKYTKHAASKPELYNWQPYCFCSICGQPIGEIEGETDKKTDDKTRDAVLERCPYCKARPAMLELYPGRIALN